MFQTAQGIFWPAPRRRDTATTAPERPKRRPPVFIHDAITPWNGETMLLALLRQQAETDD